MMTCGEFRLWFRGLRTGNSEDVDSIPGLAQQVKDLVLPQAGVRSQTQLIPSVAVAVTWAGSCSSDLAPIHAASICHMCGPKKKKKKG